MGRRGVGRPGGLDHPGWRRHGSHSGGLRPAQRRLIGERTKAALAVKKAQGVRLGRPPTLPHDVVRRIKSAKEAGASWSAIARDLNRDGIPTARGGRKWYPSTIRSVVLSATGRE